MGNKLKKNKKSKNKMGNGNVTIEKFGSYCELKCEEGENLKRIDRASGDKIPLKYLFVKISNIQTITRKKNDNDVLVCLDNGNEYCLDEIENPDDSYVEFCKVLYSD